MIEWSNIAKHTNTSDFTSVINMTLMDIIPEKMGRKFMKLKEYKLR